jgi:hypothetical protein
LESGVDSNGQGREICIGGADEDAGMIGLLAVKADEVSAVVGHDGAFVFSCEKQHLIVGYGIIGHAGIQGSQHVVTQCAESNDDGEREVFVRIEPGDQASSPLAAISRSISARWPLA